MADYSTPSRSVYGPIGANAFGPGYMSMGGKFNQEDVFQADVLDIARQVESPRNLKMGEVFLSTVVKQVYSTVGMLSIEGDQLGSCTLIAQNLAVVACHEVEGIDITKSVASFGNYLDNLHQQTLLGKEFKVVGVIEHDQEMDYAVIMFEDLPGEEFGYGKIRKGANADENPVLIHHPIKKPLKASVRPVERSNYYQRLYKTHHDSDYGSCGGGYYSPSKELVALHLGAEREQTYWNLVRYALPIDIIIQEKTISIFSKISDEKIDQTQPFFPSNKPTVYIPPIERKYIDLENYNNVNMKEYGYIVRTPDGDSPGIIIDSHQKKHSPAWPAQYGGGKGSIFPLTITNDHVVEIAEALPNIDLLFNARGSGPKKKLWWDIKKGVFSSALYKKLTNPPGKKGKKGSPVQKIEVDYVWSVKYNSWVVHFNPVYS